MLALHGGGAVLFDESFDGQEKIGDFHTSNEN
jgi:hypothetical protein